MQMNFDKRKRDPMICLVAQYETSVSTISTAQLTFTCSKSTIKTLENGVEYDQS